MYKNVYKYININVNEKQSSYILSKLAKTIFQDSFYIYKIFTYLHIYIFIYTYIQYKTIFQQTICTRF